MTRRVNQRGYVIVSVALLMVVLCGFAALAVDMGLLLSARTSAQRAADSSALAGAFTFVISQTSPQPDTAQQHAMSTALSNNILDSSVTAGEVTVNVDVPNRRVTVDIAHSRGTLFARAWGQDQADIVVRGIAEASDTATGSSCAKPWFIPNTVLSPNDSCTACANGEVFISGGQVTDYADTFIEDINSQFILKPNNPQQALGPGQFFAIRMGDSTGGMDYRTNIATCTPNLLYCGAQYGVEPGNMIGPTIQGVNDLIGPTPDTFLGPGQYQRADLSIGDTSRQLITAPVWDECSLAGFCPDNTLPDGGATLTIEIIGFAMIFLEGVTGNNVMAHLIGVSACAPGGGGGGGAGSGPEPPETGPFGVPLRLIRVPQ